MTRGQDLGFQHEVQAGKAGVLLGQGEDAFIYNRQAEQMHTRTIDSGHLQVECGGVTRFIGVLPGGQVDQQAIAMVDHYQAGISHDGAAVQNAVGVQFQRAGQVRGQIDSGGGTAALQLDKRVLTVCPERIISPGKTNREAVVYTSSVMVWPTW